jgi:hypothetical protein
MSLDQRCPDCGVLPGKLHEIGCDVEQCPYCGGQLISCDCARAVSAETAIPWTGEWPGKTECLEFGWYAKLVKGHGWVPCDRDEPGATEDLDRLHVEAKWDCDQRRFVAGSVK